MQRAPDAIGLRRIGFARAIALGFRRYFDFAGRSGLAEYWYWFLFSVLGQVASSLLDHLLSAQTGWTHFAILFDIVTLIPSLAVAVRRLHDTDRSGWWLLVPFCSLVAMIFLEHTAVYPLLLGILVVSALVIFYWNATPSQREDNRFGPYQGLGRPLQSGAQDLSKPRL